MRKNKASVEKIVLKTFQRKYLLFIIQTNLSQSIKNSLIMQNMFTEIYLIFQKKCLITRKC